MARRRQRRITWRCVACRGHTVRWVEPRYIRWLAERPRDFFAARRETPEPRLHVRPVVLANGERQGFIRAHNRYWLGRALRHPPIQAAGPTILWLYNPHEVHLADSVPHDLLVYDIMDDYTAFPWAPRDVAREEAQLLERAHLVFAGTAALAEARQPLSRTRIECVLSGVETAHFAGDGGGAADGATQELRARYRHLAGYAGMIDLRIDQHLLLKAARRLPDWGFVLIGPVRCDVSTLRQAENIHLLGVRNYEQLPACYRAWDAALLPFIENELTRHINPTKMLEYAASGRPIVARSLPDVDRFYADGAWIYRHPEEFITALQELEQEDTPRRAERLERARRWADERDWDRLADRMLARAGRALAARV